MNEVHSALTQNVLDAVHRLVRAYCRGIDPAWCDPDDAAQQALIKLARETSKDVKVSEKVNSQAWLASFCGRAIDWYLKESLRTKALWQNAVEHEIPVPSDPSDSEAGTDRPEALRDTEALTIVYRIHSETRSEGRRFIEAILNGATSRSELARAVGIQARTLG